MHFELTLISARLLNLRLKVLYFELNIMFAKQLNLSLKNIAFQAYFRIY